MASRIRAFASQLSPHLTLYFVHLLLVVTIGPLLFGYHLAELNAPQNAMTCASKSDASSILLSPFSNCIPMTTAQFGFVQSVFTSGGFIGALGVGYLADKYGRRPVLRYTAVLFTVGPVAEALAPNVYVLSLGRFVSGLAAGAAITIAPIYVSEVAPPHLRGLFGALTQIQTNFGILIAQQLGLWFSRGNLWRIILGVGGLIGFIQASALLAVTESPIWLAEHGSPAKAKKVLQRIRGPGTDIHEETQHWSNAGQEEHDGAYESLLGESPHVENGNTDESRPRSSPKVAEAVGILGVFKQAKYRRATLIIMVIMVAQQFTGINTIIMYGVKVLSTLLPAVAPKLNVFIALFNLIVTVACSPLSDKVGRKTCLIGSMAGMGVSALLFGIAVKVHVPVLAAVTVITFVGSFGIGLGPIPFILASELVGPEAVGSAQSWALAANWTATFLVAQFFPVLNDAFGPGNMYFVFAGFAVCFALFTAFFMPETKGKKHPHEVWGRHEE